ILLIKFVADDDPVIQSSIEDAAELPIPNIGFYFLSQYQFNINCTYTTGFSSTQHSCNDTTTQPKYLEYVGRPGSYGHFINKNNLTFTKLTDPNGLNAITSVFITIYSNKMSTDNVDDMSVIQSFVIDSEKSPIDIEKFNLINETAYYELPRYVSESITDNSFLLPNRQVLHVKLNRRIRKTIRSKFIGTLGINPSYDVQPYLRSSIQSMPYPVDFEFPTGLFISNVIFTFPSFLVTVETEQRTRTILGMFGLVGGAWGLAAALYASLFGVDMIRPWGCVQQYCCNLTRYHNKLKKTLPTIPFVDPSPSQNVKELQDRLNALEFVLKEYVVDVKHLENLNNFEIRNKELPLIPNTIPMNQNQRELPPIPNNHSSVPYSHPLPDTTSTRFFASSN
ncbi:15570_t:CDS:2, partial [Funneliformis caledonium]